MTWHKSSAPLIGRLAGFALVCLVVVTAIAYGFFSSGDQIDTSTGSTTAQTTTTVSDRGEDQPVVVAADNIKSIGPSGSTTTSTSPEPLSVDPNTSGSVQTTITGSAAPPPTDADITQLVLIDERTGVVLTPLTNGSVISRDQYPNASLSVEALATSITESVVFSVNGLPRRLEDVSPYELNGTTTWLRLPGDYSLSASAYSQDNAQGVASAPFTIQLIVE